MLILASKLQGKKETLICFSQYLNFVVSKRGGWTASGRGGQQNGAEEVAVLGTGTEQHKAHSQGRKKG